MPYQKKYFFLFLFFVNGILASGFTFSASKARAPDSKVLFEKALNQLKNNNPSSASKLFSKLLKTHPESKSGRFNLALSLYQQPDKKDQARAILRQVLFEDPYHAQTRSLLKQLKDKKYFWLWIPEDFILALMALGLSGLIFAIFRKSLPIFRLGVGLFLIFQGFGAYYFYLRALNYGSLKQDSPVLSGPDPSAPVLFEQKAGTLLKALSMKTQEGLIHVQISNNRGWLNASKFLPLNRRKNQK